MKIIIDDSAKNRIMEIIIDGITYEAHKKIGPDKFVPKCGDFIVNTGPAYGYWIVEKVLFSVIKNRKIVVVGVNSNGNLTVTSCTYKYFLKDNKLYSGETGANPNDFSWWFEQQGD